MAINHAHFKCHAEWTFLQGLTNLPTDAPPFRYEVDLAEQPAVSLRR